MGTTLVGMLVKQCSIAMMKTKEQYVLRDPQNNRIFYANSS